MRLEKLQSAMEYLMTYGWAILIIAVVLGALFGLGFFNSANLAPKVSAGACQVYRPNGPGTASFINLEGTCNNELPQYVAQFSGVSDSVTTQTFVGIPAGSSTRSLSAWVYVTSSASEQGMVSIGDSAGNSGDVFGLILFPTATALYYWDGESDGATGLTFTPNVWHFMAVVQSGASVIVYLDGSHQTLSTAAAQEPLNPVLYVGQMQGQGHPFGGSMANIQIYNTSLSSNEVTALYGEGIGGSPVLLRNLVGWYPLNGNANDYSGNLNNGAAAGIVYTSSWTNGYAAP